jgi:hypothetical protein
MAVIEPLGRPSCMPTKRGGDSGIEAPLPGRQITFTLQLLPTRHCLLVPLGPSAQKCFGRC